MTGAMIHHRRALGCAGCCVAATLGAACGGGPATLHPAHVLPQAKVVLGAGVSGNFAGGDVETKIRRGRSLTTPGVTTPDPEQAFVDGAVTTALVGTGVAPWVGGRVGLGARTEGLLTYTGRSARGGIRHAFQNETWAFSVGAGGSAHLLRAGSSGPEGSEPTAGRFQGSTDDVHVTGFGLDLPIVAGYRSAGDILAVWAGGRVGFDRVSGDLPLSPSGPDTEATGRASTANLDGSRWYTGGLLGLAVGLSPVWVGVQMDAAYQSVSGRVENDDPAAPVELDVDATGFTLTPSGIIWGKF